MIIDHEQQCVVVGPKYNLPGIKIGQPELWDKANFLGQHG
jgi:hypothetical protein